MRSTCESANDDAGHDRHGDDESDHSQSTASNLADETLILSDHQGVPTLFDLVREERWEVMSERLENTPPIVVRDQTDPSDNEDDAPGDTILHVVAGMERVPVQVVEKIISRILTIESSIASLRNCLQQTPLHIAVFSIPERTDVIERLYHACPENVQARDALRLRPIDIITERIIMLEEVIKYSTREEVDWDGMIKRFWESVGVLVGASKSGQCSKDGNDDETTRTTSPLLLHACLRSKDVPFALTDRAMKHNKGQLELVDDNGDLPLHTVSRIPPPVRRRATSNPEEEEDDDDDSDDEDDDNGEGDFMNRILSAYPQAAAQYNHAHQLPLIVAIESGRKWNSGISRLLEVYPSAIQDAHLPLNIFPFMFERLSSQPDITYRILQSLPDVFLYNRD